MNTHGKDLLKPGHDGRAKPSVAERPWYKSTLAILGLTGTVIGVASAVFGLWKSSAEPPSPIETNVEVVVDTSEEFGAKFERGSTKADATSRALSQALARVSDSDNLALR